MSGRDKVEDRAMALPSISEVLWEKGLGQWRELRWIRMARHARLEGRQMPAPPSKRFQSTAIASSEEVLTKYRDSRLAAQARHHNLVDLPVGYVDLDADPDRVPIITYQPPKGRAKAADGDGGDFIEDVEGDADEDRHQRDEPVEKHKPKANYAAKMDNLDGLLKRTRELAEAVGEEGAPEPKQAKAGDEAPAMDTDADEAALLAEAEAADPSNLDLQQTALNAVDDADLAALGIDAKDLI